MMKIHYGDSPKIAITGAVGNVNKKGINKNIKCLEIKYIAGWVPPKSANDKVY